MCCAPCPLLVRLINIEGTRRKERFVPSANAQVLSVVAKVVAKEEGAFAPGNMGKGPARGLEMEN